MKLACYKDTITAITENATNHLIRLNCLLADLTHSHHYTDSLQLFHQIHSSRYLRPDHYTLSTALTASANLRNATTGNQLHAHSILTGLKAYPHVANTLLSLYAKSEDLVSVKRVFSEIENPDVYSWTTLLSACMKLGQVRYACHVFDEMPQRSVAVWNAIITGCEENGYEDLAFDLFRRMHTLGVRHDNYTFASVLSLCSSELLDFGKQVQSLAIKTGFSVKCSVVNALLTMYFYCGSVTDAYQVFEEAEGKACDQITYNVMIAGLVNTGRGEEAFLMFREMQEVCLRPTELTFVSVLSSCSCERVGYNVHAQTIQMGFESFTSVSNAAITMYSNFGDLRAAHMVFQRLEEKDLVSWNTIITSYAQGSLGGEAILAYLQMRREGIAPDEFTIGSLLGSSDSLVVVEMIQAVVLKSVLILKIQVSNALVSAFSKHGKVEEAYQIFCEMSVKNLISWNAIISGFQLNGFPQQSLEQFSKLLESGLKPNVYTLTIVLSICASISTLRHGKQIHGYVIKFGFSPETSLGNALITLYAKCGDLDWSLRVFSAIIDKDTVSWNSLISAYAQHGKGMEAVNCFEGMQELGGVKPDQATFTAVLSACSHAGLVDHGTRIFNSMVNKYGFEPGVDQFSCIIDLLGRAGYLDEAKGLLNNKHIGVDSSIWWTLFGSCANHGDVRLGRIVAGFLLEIEEKNPAVYVLLSKIYADAGQWEEAANMRELMKRYGVMKQPGCSWMRS
ncbi:pentatricopeptide repeat-containing protein At3g49740 [Cornus florida]|uniref:pentatricopeptide repeat-containing protein At3g49740 n=1 Tax=Cornus florida TaxID=4283 RepID=UPI00289F47E5|nr:pentatricopeptide repeat-containing protein At3g49740 [Cornus florida]XP_059624047.1 pentatricopeptide repeat-containing protein At3g49740 [Cornus florida]XP_059624048.1 pentatricopeptide repeat-containing protein At3g49740 [Cornus florida]XP_059624049.1 pentatricopeptide repeat-containing protein At3g49740 [Cornus florida]XP_059624051.1 pentatricopeptide repeat-containing protein At3g49740 [Cornus florida]XP_059624052.1 pentatricopeptide repeat-containing protein At3g49740 [Cornus florida]